MKTKILVTGGTGYIGSHTVAELQQSGYDVVIIDDLSNSNETVLEGITKITGIAPVFEKIDLCNKDLLRTFFKKFADIAGVVHFAAHKAVGESVEFPLKYYSNNLISIINLLWLMEENRIPNIVFSSSCSVYGDPDHSPVSENAPPKPAKSPYGNTKKICEDIISDTSQASDIHAVLLRYFNPVGAHSTGFIGELPSRYSDNIMPAITKTAKKEKEFIEIYGGDYNTPDGTCIRDYIHVVDVAKAHVFAIKRLLHKQIKSKCEVFNLGTGTGYSVLDIIKAFENATGIKLNYKISERRSGDVVSVYADTALANNELDWKAEKSLEEMVSSAWKWEQKLQMQNT